MATICELTGTGPIKGNHIWRSGKAKKTGGIGTHVTAITKRRFMPNLQRVKALINGEVRYIRVTAAALHKGIVIKATRRTWTKDASMKRVKSQRLHGKFENRGWRFGRYPRFSTFPCRCYDLTGFTAASFFQVRLGALITMPFFRAAAVTRM